MATNNTNRTSKCTTQWYSIYFNQTGARLWEFNDFGYVFDIVFNEYEFNNDLSNIFNNGINESGMDDKSGLSNGLFFQKSGVSDFRIRDCDVIGCIFGGILYENEFYYYANNAFDDYFDDDICVYLFILLTFKDTNEYDNNNNTF